MSASLVGSEMCIRDSRWAVGGKVWQRRGRSATGPFAQRAPAGDSSRVSGMKVAASSRACEFPDSSL
eukprot:6111782-Alexandrium_andersonii.AAC.1